MNIHVCLVSQQAAANVLPALDPNLKKPDNIVLVVTNKMQSQADNLQSVFQETGIRTTRLKLTNEQDYHGIENQLLDLAQQLSDDDVTLNITGGTKLMSIAAQSVAQASDWKMFYVDADTDSVIWLGKEKPPPYRLQEQLKLNHYLRSYGFRIDGKTERTQASKAQQACTQTLVQNVVSLESSITTLNALAQDAESRRSLDVQMTHAQNDSRSLDTLLRDFQGIDALTLKGKQIHFTDEAARDFVKGGWLEQHVMQIVHEITGPLNIRDKAINLQVSSGVARNELDIAFMARNRLFVIECKTARIDRPQGSGDRIDPPKANDTLFKLSENCRRIGGLGTRGMLVTYRRLRDPELNLARSLGITVVAGNQIAQLADQIKKWVQPVM